MITRGKYEHVLKKKKNYYCLYPICTLTRSKYSNALKSFVGSVLRWSVAEIRAEMFEWIGWRDQGCIYIIRAYYDLSSLSDLADTASHMAYL